MATFHKRLTKLGKPPLLISFFVAIREYRYAYGEYKREDIIDALLVELFEQCLMLLRQVYLDLLWNAFQKLVLEGGKVVDGGQKNIGIIQDACRHCLTTRTVGEVARRAVLTEVG